MAETVSRAYLVLLASLMVLATAPSFVSDWEGHVIRSGSMEPHISAGDVVLTSPLPDSSPVPVGRVVVFQTLDETPVSGSLERSTASERSLVMHRIVAAGEEADQYITAGDANAEVDSTPLSREQITGQGRLLIPWVGLPKQWLDTGSFLTFAGWGVLTAAAIAVLALSPPTHAPPGPRPGPPTSKGRHKLARHAPRGVGVGVSLSLLTIGLTQAFPLSAETAFTAQTSTASNTWTAAVLKSRAISAVQVYDTPEANGWYRRSGVSVNISATPQTRTHASAISYSINGAETVTTPGASVTPRVDRQGVNTLTYYSTDEAGVNEAPQTIEIMLDNQAPSLEVSSRTGDFSHEQWQMNCTEHGGSGGLCGTAVDGAGSGTKDVSYILYRSKDGRCFDGNQWVSAACSTPTSATLESDTWFASVPDQQLDRERVWYTMTIFATDVAGNQTNTTRGFSVG